MSTPPTIEELSKRIAFLEETLDQRTGELNQRLRELNCMAQISRLSDRPGLSFGQYITETLDIVRSSFEQADIASAELKLGDDSFRTPGFQPSEWKLGRGLMDQDRMIGYLTVYYSESTEVREHGPFTKEEKNFMIVISRYLVQIIKRKQFEDQLIVFREVLEQSPHIIYITDNKGRIEFLNEKATQVFGDTMDALKGKVHYLKLAENEDEKIKDDLRNAMIEGRTFKGEMKAEGKNGFQISVRATVSPIFKDHQIISYITELEDITQEAEGKRLFWEQQERYRTVVENSPVAISLVDRNGKFIFVNHQAEVDLRRPAAEILNKTVLEIFEGEGRETMKLIRKIFRDKKGLYSESSYKINGIKMYFEVAREPIFDQAGNVSFVMSLVNNITERKQMDHLVRFQHSIDSLQSISDTFEHSLSALFDNVFSLDWVDAGGLYAIDESGQNLELIHHRGLSDAFVELTRSFPLTSPGVQVMFNKQPRFSSIEDYHHPTRQAALDENMTFICALPLIFQDKPIGSLNLASRKVHSLSDFDMMTIISLAGRVANLVQLLQTQENLKMTNKHLSKALISLQENRQLLIQKSRLESLGELSAGLAHEINQPLSIISLAIENLELKLRRGMTDKEYLVKKFGSISSNINKIRQLIDHVRLFSRDQKENLVQRIDVNHTIKEALSLINEQLRNHRIAVTLNLGEELGVVIGNQSRLEQVFMNLLSNSRDALDEREKISAKPTVRKEIRITTQNVGEFTEIEFWDNGTGIGDEDMERMFDPFFTTKPYGQGTGLGLPIVYGIIREMNGTVEAKSADGKYMRILIRIPAHKSRDINT
jgi:PAS domain S-box-containing protein